MDEILDSINSLILKTSGGLIAFWLLVSYFFVQGFKFLGGCMAEGAINKGIAKIIPIVKAEFKVEFDSIKEDMDDLKKGLAIYKEEKHSLQGENSNLKEAIVLNDPELLSQLKKTILKESYGK